MNILLGKSPRHSPQAAGCWSENEKSLAAFMPDPLSNAAPVGTVGGHGQPAPPTRSPENSAQAPVREGLADGVVLHLPAAIVRRLLRERVLARTRARLGLKDGECVPSFAEEVDAESLDAFVGRLLGAQNQLAALRNGAMPKPELRRRLDEAMRDGTAEVIEMLTGDGSDLRALAAVEVVAEVLAEYARRLAAGS